MKTSRWTPPVTGNPIPKEEPKPKPMAKAKFDPSRRRHSVSVSGVSGVIGLQSGFAGLSGPGEKVFDVQVRRMQLCLFQPMFLV